MGTDVYIDGELTIPSAKVLEAGTLILLAIADKDEVDPEYLPSCYSQKILTPKGIHALLEERLMAFEVELGDDGGLTFAIDDCTRREDSDQWVFKALAPVIDDGEFYMSAEDYKWMWEIRDGEFREVNSETVYDHDENAEPTVAKLVTLIYPENLNGKPVTSIPDFDAVWVVEMVENLLRETGYGPQAGKNGLERLSEV